MPHRHRFAAAAAAFFVNTVVCAAQIYTASFYNKTPYHTSALSGHAWVQELINGHPERIKCELGMKLDILQALIEALHAVGLQDTRNISLEEHLPYKHDRAFNTACWRTVSTCKCHHFEV